jgi:HK97 gp10 family phage protein
MGLSIHTTGVKEIDDVLRGLPDQVSDRVLQAASASAAKPLVSAAQELAPKRKGGLRDSIGVQRTGFAQVGKQTRDVGEVMAGPRRGKYKGQHGHLAEYGTRRRSTKKGANRGTMPVTKFMEPAFNRTKDFMIGIYNSELSRKLSAFMRRTIKKAGV